MFHSRFCYYDCLDVRPSEALVTLYAAKKYMLPVLEDTCRRIQMKTLGPDNIWDVYASCISHPDEMLLRECWKFFGQSVAVASAALKSPQFVDLPHEVVVDLLKVNDDDLHIDPSYEPCDRGEKFRIMVPQIELFQACNAWTTSLRRF